MLAFTLLISLGTGIAFGTFPAFPGTRDLGGAIKDGARSTAAGGLRLRHALIVAQVALVFILLIGAA